MKSVSRPTNCSVKAGFTLLELLTAMVLLAILMAALAGLIPRFAGRATDRDVIAQALEHEWARIVLDRLAEDLVHAESAELIQNTFRLAGRLQRDPEDDQFTNRLGTCDYRWRSMRDQLMLEVWQGDHRELLCCGPFAVEINLIDQGKELRVLRFEYTAQALEKPAPIGLAPLMRLSLLDRQRQPMATRLVVRQALDIQSIKSEAAP